MKQIAVKVSNLNNSNKAQSRLSSSSTSSSSSVSSDHHILDNSNCDPQANHGSVSSLVSLISNNNCNLTKPLQYCPSHSSLSGSVHYDKPPSRVFSSSSSQQIIKNYPKNSKLVNNKKLFLYLLLVGPNNASFLLLTL